MAIGYGSLSCVHIFCDELLEGTCCELAAIAALSVLKHNNLNGCRTQADPRIILRTFQGLFDFNSAWCGWLFCRWSRLSQLAARTNIGWR